jgi:NAD(P)-dependent dehydrogenase (short-subunit alcohol dehydrogenase family)
VAVHYHRAAEQARSLLEILTPVQSGHLMVQEDVSRAEDVGRIFAETMEAFGSLDILVANAGIWEGRAIVLASQFPIAAWHELIGNPSIADAIIDRLASGAHRIELQGESVRGGNAQSPTTRDGVEVAS